jgi:hypothetical protein
VVRGGVEPPTFRFSEVPLPLSHPGPRIAPTPSYLHNGWSELTKPILAAVPSSAGQCGLSAGFLWGHPRGPGFVGILWGADGVLAAGLPASGVINGSIPCAVQRTVALSADVIMRPWISCLRSLNGRRTGAEGVMWPA